MIEIIPKKLKKPLPWENISFYIAGAFLVIVILSYLALIYFESKVSASLEDVKGEIAQMGTPEDKILEQEVFQSERRIKDFSILLSERRSPANFFGNFEKLCHPKVWFSDFSLDLVKMEAIVSGYAVNFQTLGQQLVIFKAKEAISEVNLTDLTIGERGEAEFTLSLSLKSEMFNSQ